jgi:hypothetical protein
MLIKHLLENTSLTEIKMSPTSLAAMAAKIPDAKVGMEFEMYVPNVSEEDLEPEWEPDYDEDGYITTGTWDRFKRDIIQFFTGGDFASLSRREVERILDRDVYPEFQEWLDSAFNDWATAEGNFSEWWEEENPDEREPSEGTSGYSLAMDEFREEKYDDWAIDGDHINDWLEDNRMDKYLPFSEKYDLGWPYMTDANEGRGGTTDLSEIAADFKEAVGMPVQVSTSYHGKTKPTDAYMIEPDSSLSSPESSNDGGLEFVSPPLSVPEMIDQLKKVKEWAGMYGCYTNSTTGLHINVSLPGYSIAKLDYIKLALFLGDEYVSDQFGRLGNTYAKSAMAEIRKRVRKQNDSEAIAGLMNAVKGNMARFASKIIHSGETEKFVSINTKDNRIEFRSPGGDWMDSDLDKVINTMLRFVVAVDIALDPEKEKQEYAKKFYKMLSAAAPAGDDTIKYFAQYAAGTLPSSALKSFVRNVQQKRPGAKTPPSAATAAAPAAGEKSYEIIYMPGQSSSDRVVHTFTAVSPSGAQRYAQNWADEHDISARYRVQLVGGPRGGEVGTYKITYTQNGQEQQTVVDANSRREAVDFFQSNWPGTATLVRLELMP